MQIYRYICQLGENIAILQIDLIFTNNVWQFWQIYFEVLTNTIWYYLMQKENLHLRCQPVRLSFGFESWSGWKHFWCKYEEFSDGKSKFLTCFKISFACFFLFKGIDRPWTSVRKKAQLLNESIRHTADNSKYIIYILWSVNCRYPADTHKVSQCKM